MLLCEKKKGRKTKKAKERVRSAGKKETESERKISRKKKKSSG